MERFPKLALEIVRVPYASKRIEKIDFIPLEKEVLYVFGLNCGEGYFQAKTWLSKKATNRLVFLEEDREEIARFLHFSKATEILEHPQITISHLDDLDLLIETFPSNEIEVIS
ncbi:MAG: hypothetical protein FJZ64_03615, partial [Chlamydiae bacterium]|nr:hypothetical protein [Chlamydiota bacterium]